LILLLLALCVFGTNARSDPALNKDGSIVTGVLTASFDPLGTFSGRAVLPFPASLLYTGTTDLTLNPPLADPGNLSDPVVALSALDGFSTTEKWTTGFADNASGDYNNSQPGSIDPASVVPGQSVRVFEVTTQSFVAVTSIVRELIPWVDYLAVAATDSIIAIVPLKPLPEYSSFMAVLTNDINDLAGNDATPDRFYNFAKQQTPWVDGNGTSTSPLFGDEIAADLEGFRQVVQSMELNAAAVGINPADIILSWTVQTQSITPTLKLLRSIAQPGPVLAAPTGLNTAAVGGFGLADIVIGVITLPYYSGIPSAENPIAPLSDIWRAAPGAYVPPFDQFGLDPTSTNISVANPFPVLTGMQTVPFIMTVPNANSGMSKPAEGWPVIIFVHGITRNRTDMLRLADAAASVGYVIVAMDLPLHGVVPDVAPELAPFYIENTPFAPIANERTFDADYWNNMTGAPGPDGIMDASGTSYFNLANLLAVRDNQRQSQVDLSILAMSLQNISVDGDATPDLNAFNVGVVAQSLGVYNAVPFLAVEPIVSRAYLNAGGAVGIRTIEAGFFGIQMRAALAAAGILPGTSSFEQFLTVAQTVFDPVDTTSWAAEAAMKMPILHNQVVNDDTVPNFVPGSPMAGNEGLNRIMGLQSYATTQVNPDGLRAVARFLEPAVHSSLFRPESSPGATVEMQTQMASFFASLGTFVQVGNPELLVPVVQVEPQQATDLTGNESEKAGSGKKQIRPPNRFGE
jgi:hypothetical protein